MTETTEPTTPNQHPESLQALLGSKRKRQAALRRKVFVIPGYDGQLGARMQCMDAEGMIKDGAVGLSDADADNNATEIVRGRCGLIARSCVEMLIRADPQGEWQPLREVDGGPVGVPVKFDERLVRYLGGTPDDLLHPVGEAPGASDAVRWVIGEGSSYNLATLYMDLIVWVNNETPGVDDELVGESSAAS